MKTKINNKLIKETESNSMGLAKEIQKGAKAYGFIFVHSYEGDVEEILKMGSNVIDRPEMIKCNKNMIVVSSKVLKQGSHIFLGVCRLKGLAKGYVEFVENGLAYISGMGETLITLDDLNA